MTSMPPLRLPMTGRTDEDVPALGLHLIELAAEMENEECARLTLTMTRETIAAIGALLAPPVN